MATPDATAPPRRNLLSRFLPKTTPVGLTGEGSGASAKVQALEMEISWLNMQIAQFQKEQAMFESAEPFFLGSEHVANFVPPIPGSVGRASVGSPTMAGYLLSSDAWQILLSRWLRPNSVMLDIGCGTGKMARCFAHHPHLKKYVGFDVIPESIEFCKEMLSPRIGPKFEFHHFDLLSCYNPDGKIKPSEVVFPVATGSVDLAFGISLFTHLFEEDARHYLREVRRALSPAGMFLPSIHINPAPGTRYSGDEVRIDIDPDYFVEMCDDAGMECLVRLGNALGQYTMLFRPKQGEAVSTVVNVGGVKTEDQLAEAAKPKPPGVPVPPNGGALSEETLRFNKQWADKEQVTDAVHPKDYIFWFVATHPEMSLEDATKYYFEDGARSATKLDGHFTRHFGADKQVKLLEFASGYGCVSRHLKKNPRIDLTSCDIHPEAIEFLKNRIGVKALQSAHTPEDFTTPEKYDAIFALSFFSHMPKATFGRWIKALYGALNPGGCLLFTTHGVKSCQGLQITVDDADEEGFWFQARSEQHDLDVAEYGLTLSLPHYVIPTVYKNVGAPIADYRQAEWWYHQDLWVVKKEA